MSENIISSLEQLSDQQTSNQKTLHQQFSHTQLKPQKEEQLLYANQQAKEQVKLFFQNFAKFNTEYALNPATASLPQSTCLIVKGPPGCGKNETIELFMRQFNIKNSFTFSMAIESRNSSFMDSKFNDTLTNCPIGGAVILKNIEALSINGKSSPSKKLLSFIDSPGMALHSAGARLLRDRAAPEVALQVRKSIQRIVESSSRKKKDTTKVVSTDYENDIVAKRKVSAIASLAKKRKKSNEEDLEDEKDVTNDDAEEGEDENADDLMTLDDFDTPERRMPKKKTAADAERARFARNTKACVSRKPGEPSTLDAVYRANYPFTTHVPLILVASDHQHHLLFTEFRKLSHCTFVQFRQPPTVAISARIEQIFTEFNVRAPKPNQERQTFLVSEIATYASGDIRKAMQIVALGIHRAIRNDQGKGFYAFKRKYVEPLFDRQLCAQNDNFTAVSYLALDCTSLSLALQHVAKPRLAMVPYTLYQSFFRLLPHAPDSEALTIKQRRQDYRTTSRTTIVPRLTQNSNKGFSLQRIKQKLFGKIQQNHAALRIDVPAEDKIRDTEFCLALMRQFIGSEPDEIDETTVSNTLNRAAESLCRADFEEVFSWADMVTQEFCCRRSPLLQQTWHDSTVAWAFMLRKAGEKFPTYGFIEQPSYSGAASLLSREDKVQVGFVQSTQICNGRNSKGTGKCVKNTASSSCTCHWLTAPSLRGDRGVRLQWFKSSVVERDLYDINTRAICQSTCDRFFFYTNYISSMQQVRKRGQMLVNLQSKRK